MFDLGWPELLLIALVALVVLGPKELPGAIRTVTGLFRKARGMAREFHRSLEDMARESGLDEVKRDIQKATRGSLDDDVKGALDDPFSEADRNSILKPGGATTAPKNANGTNADADKTAADAGEAAPGTTTGGETSTESAAVAKQDGRA